MSHHEMWDGNGYPFGLVGEHFDPVVVDAFVAVDEVFREIAARHSG